MYHNMNLGCMLVLLLAGCMPPPSSALSEGRVLIYLGDPSVQTSVEYVGLDDRVVLVIWSDVAESSSSNSASTANGFTLNGESSSKDGRKLVWKCDVSADGAGTLTLNDKKYGLAEGCIFLVSARRASVNVQQLSRAPIVTSEIGQWIRKLAKEKEFTEFFSQQSPEDGT